MGPGDPPSPHSLFWVKKEEVTGGRKASRASKIKPGPLLAQGLDLPMQTPEYQYFEGERGGDTNSYCQYRSPHIPTKKGLHQNARMCVCAQKKKKRHVQKDH